MLYGMKSALLLLGTFCAATAIASAQDQLTPDPGILAEKHEYYAKLREVFAEVYRSNVVLQVVLLPSFEPEEIAGIRETDAGFEAFVAKPSSIIWETYSIYEAETEEQRRADEQGKDFPLDPNSGLVEMKRNNPSDFRKITIHIDARPIPTQLKTRIEHVWQRMLLGARHPVNPPNGTDGETFHFSMWIYGRGFVSAQTWSPDRGKARALTDLALALPEYARGAGDEKQLIKLLKPLER
ncbi:MAG: hypothetical protein QOE26_1554 [Verrucomicrobiota bacterium]|jgi:hypothetical protein